MDDMNPNEKKQAFEDFQNKRERMYKVGKIIMLIIAILNIIMAVLSFFLNLNFISLLIQIILSIALFRGVTWVRYFFAIGAGLSSIATLLVLQGILNSGYPLPIIVFFIIYLIYSIAGTIVLFASKSVSEFLYAQKNG